VPVKACGDAKRCSNYEGGKEWSSCSGGGNSWVLHKSFSPVRGRRKKNSCLGGGEASRSVPGACRFRSLGHAKGWQGESSRDGGGGELLRGLLAVQIRAVGHRGWRGNGRAGSGTDCLFERRKGKRLSEGCRGE